MDNDTGAYKANTSGVHKSCIRKELVKMKPIKSISPTTWKEVESEGRLDLLWTDGCYDRMACIVATRASCADVKVCRKNVDELPLAFISPLRTKNNGYWYVTIRHEIKTRPKKVYHS